MKKVASLMIVSLLLLAGCSFRAPAIESGESVSEIADNPAIQEHFSLIGSLPEDDIYLYGINDWGFVLYHEGVGVHLNSFKNDDEIQIKHADFDGDRVKDIAIAGISVPREHNTSGLYLLKIRSSEEASMYGRKSFGKYDAHTIVSHDLLSYEDFSLDGMTASYKGEAFDAISDVDIKDVGRALHFLEMSFVEFTEDNKFVFSVPIGHSYKSYSRSFCFARMIITVSFDGTNSKIDNYTFEKQEISYEGY